MSLFLGQLPNYTSPMSDTRSSIPSSDRARMRSGLLGLLVAVALGAALAVVTVVGATSAVAGEAPGKPAHELVSYDQ